MATVDNLQIQINAQAVKANEAIDRLVTKLDTLTTSLNKLDGSKLTGLANGVQRLGSAMQTMNTIKTSDFTRLATNLTKLGNVDVSALNSTASSMSHLTRAFNSLGTVSANAQAVGDMAKNISKLGNKSVQTAITNIPQLATSLNNLMTTLSRSPQVSQNVIQMTNALANLASQGSRVGTASSSMVRGLNNSSTAATKAKKSFGGLAATFGKFYASYFLVIRGIKTLWKSVESAMDYVEVYNYFNAAFKQVSSRAVDQWGEAGDDSAEAYAESFRNRAEQLTEKMTGFEVTEIGTLKNANIQNLGLDPSQLMNYQAMFAQMSSSMGNTSETALKLSDALTMIGADLASVKNMDFEKTWNDMSSGLAGMSRTLDKYGVNIRNVNLQERMHQAGIQGSITALNQEDKALLRATILLESTEYAWGDLGNTLSQPANQLRLMQANFNNLGRTIGNIFLPYVASAIKYVSGFTIALQRLLEPIAALVAAKFPDFDWGGSKAGSSEALSNILDESGELSDNFESATESAKKFENQILGFDEATKLNEPSGSGTTSAGNIDTSLLEEQFDSIYEKYKAVWERAYQDAENPANEIAERIINAFKSGDYSGIGRYISSNISNALKSINWNSVYEGAKNFGTGLAEFFNGLITPDLFGSVGKTIAAQLNSAIYTALSFGQTFDFKNLGESIASGINNFFSTFDFGAFAETINVWVQGIFDTIINIFDKTNWEEIGEEIGNFISKIDFTKVAVKIAKLFWKAINAAFDTWSKIFETAPIETALISLVAMPKLFKAITASKFITGFKKLATNVKLLTTALAGNQASTALLLTQYPKLGKAVDVARKAFANFRFGIENGNFLTGLNEGIKTVRNNLTGMQKGVITSVAGFAEFKVISNTFNGLISGTENLLSGVAKIGGVAAAAAAAMYTAFGPAGLAVAAITGAIAVVKGMTDALSPNIKISADVQEAIDNMQSVIDKWNEVESSLKSQISDIDFDFGGIQIMSDKYYELSKNYSNLTEEEKSLLSFYSDELKKSLPEITGYIDEQTGAFIGTKEQLQAIIDKTKEYYKLQAVEEYLKEAYKAQAEIEKQLKSSNENIEKQQKELRNAKKTYEEYRDEIDNSASIFDDIVRNATTALGFNEQGEKLKKLKDNYLSLEKGVKELEEEHKNLTKTYQDSVKDIDYWEEQAEIAYENQAKNVQEYADTVKTESLKIKSDYEGVGSSFEETTNLMKTDSQNAVGRINDYLTKINTPFLKIDTSVFSSKTSDAIDNANIKLKTIITPSLGINVSPFTKNSNNAVNGINNLLSTGITTPSINVLTNDAMFSINGFVDAANRSLKNIGIDFDFNFKESSSPTQTFRSLSLVPKKYATGGFPEDGLFFANHNELVGQFSNGKTVVANNEQITDGIAEAVYNAFMAAKIDNGNSSKVPIIKVYVGERELTDIAIDGINDRIISSGKNPLKI